MTRIIRNIIGIVLVVFLNSTWFANFPVKPDIILILIVWLSLRQGAFPGEVTGFFVGFAEDILSLSPLGFHMTARTLVGLSVGSIRDFVGIDRLVIPVLFSSAAFMIQSVWLAIIIRLFSVQVTHSPLFSLASLWSFLLTIGMAPLVFLIADFISLKFAQIKDRII